ncbi:hypothetical protein B0920_24860 [Massilia sp. KIM]|uniref:hypothetical protein n=1 Tax=Massilia sp. KIM TaxID=1955422 RepID=UPI00098F602A|nr:hypothetical protein [Massilia sp. KIM]OON59152.1 hypothetical protein B0920_24860 [Massilia sp. KIM]
MTMNTRPFVILVSLLFALPLEAAEKLPKDVQQFIERRETCEHFLGEMPDPDQRERMKEVERQLDKYCRGTDRTLASLKKKYSRNPAIVRRLAHYDARIEPGTEAFPDERR